MLMIANEFGII